MKLAPGTRLGPYVIVSAIGAGGMGEVYRARDPRLGRDVAIKVILDRSRDPEMLRRFELEARSAARLSHPNVVSVFDVGTEDGTPFVVSELLEGVSLRERLRSGPLPLPRPVEVAAAIGRGLAVAHAQGIVHRDLKPENLFLTKDGRVKILDFGLAKVHTLGAAAAGDLSMTSLTGTGAVLGTAGYMAPEQIRGEKVDARCDLFALGCVLYEMVTGRRAFEASSSVETMSLVLGSEPPPLLQSRPDAPPALQPIVQHCLEKDPDHRFQSARDVVFALEHLSALSGGEPPTPAPGPSATAWIVAACALVGAFALAFALRGRGPAQPSFQRISYRRGIIASARFAPDGHTIVYGAAFDGEPVRLYMTHLESPESSPMDLPEANLLGLSRTGTLALTLHPRLLPPIATYMGTLAQAPPTGGAPREILEHVTWGDWAPDGVRLTVVHGASPIAPPPDPSLAAPPPAQQLEFPIGHVVYRSQGWLSHPRVSHDGRRIAFIDHPMSTAQDGGDVVLLDRDGRIRRLSRGWQSIQGLAWAPGDREVWFSAAHTGNARDLWGVSLRGAQRLILRMAGGLTLHDISPDGHVLLARESFRDGIIALLPGASRERDLSWLDWSDIADLSDDGRTIVFTEMGEGVGPDNAVCLRGTDGSPVVQLGIGYATALSPNGRWVVSMVSSPKPHLALWPTHAGQPRPLDPGRVRTFNWAMWMPDSRRVVFSGTAGATPDGQTFVQDIDGGPPRAVTPPGKAGEHVTPDGRYVWIGDSLVGLAGQPSRHVPDVASDDLILQFGADGRSAYTWRFGVLPMPVYRIDLDTGRRQLWKTLMPADPAGLVGLGPVRMTRDGRTFAYTYGRLLSDLYVVTGLR